MSEEQTTSTNTDEQLLTAYASGMVSGIVTHHLGHDPATTNDEVDRLIDSARSFVQRRVMSDPLIREDLLQRLHSGVDGGMMIRLGGAQ